MKTYNIVLRKDPDSYLCYNDKSGPGYFWSDKETSKPDRKTYNIVTGKFMQYLVYIIGTDSVKDTALIWTGNKTNSDFDHSKLLFATGFAVFILSIMFKVKSLWAYLLCAGLLLAGNELKKEGQV